MVTITGKLVERGTGRLVGVLVTSGGAYTCALTTEKAKSIGVQDIDLVDYMDFNEVEVFVAPDGRYAVCDGSDTRLDGYDGIPYIEIDDNTVLLQGYLFKANRLCCLDNEIALSYVLSNL